MHVSHACNIVADSEWTNAWHGERYFVEGDHEHTLFSRFHRSLAYQRAKGDDDTLPLGCRKDVYETGYEWVNHSMCVSVRAGGRAGVIA